MKVGSVVDLIVPSEIAFGEAGRSQMVPPYATVLYKLEMISIMSAKEHKAEQDRIRREQMAKFDKNKVESERFLGENSKKDGVVVLPSGLQYKVITTGEGPIPQASDKVKVHYHGTIIDGTVFDSSVERGTPSEFQVTGVIEGWQEALQLMPVGSKWVLYIPSDLAYKDNARGQVIEPNMALVFEVELLEILGSGE
ncbi:MAG: FKBP-type peptidyl-prolyl cis-trans isomerase [Bacteroidales bacterium]|nr:FKBP-type peptidyl-prolyl cis-trans isomerase [Bacteroidales bacterium]